MTVTTRPPETRSLLGKAPVTVPAHGSHNMAVAPSPSSSPPTAPQVALHPGNTATSTPGKIQQEGEASSSAIKGHCPRTTHHADPSCGHYIDLNPARPGRIIVPKTPQDGRVHRVRNATTTPLSSHKLQTFGIPSFTRSTPEICSGSLEQGRGYARLG